MNRFLADTLGFLNGAIAVVIIIGCVATGLASPAGAVVGGALGAIAGILIAGLACGLIAYLTLIERHLARLAGADAEGLTDPTAPSAPARPGPTRISDQLPAGKPRAPGHCRLKIAPPTRSRAPLWSGILDHQLFQLDKFRRFFRRIGPEKCRMPRLPRQRVVLTLQASGLPLQHRIDLAERQPPEAVRVAARARPLFEVREPVDLAPAF